MSLLTDLFDAQLAVIKSDLAADVIPAIQKANNLIAANPTVINLIAQANQILVTAEAELPKLGQDEIKALSLWVNSKLQQLAAPATTPA